jgi:hypothetical protein
MNTSSGLNRLMQLPALNQTPQIGWGFQLILRIYSPVYKKLSFYKLNFIYKRLCFSFSNTSLSLSSFISSHFTYTLLFYLFLIPVLT